METERLQAPLILGIAGYGTVGSGLIQVLTDNATDIAARAGRPVRIKSVLDRDFRPRAVPLPEGARLTDRMEDLTDDPEIDVVVELMGGLTSAKTLIQRALSAGKHVVCANKALLAETGNELFALAGEKGLHLGYEASVCGVVPVVRTLREGLTADRVHTLVGILNGTGNYILSEMTARGLPFAAALKQAQALGYAEADPTLDIDGIDTAHKLALLIRLAWNVEYPFADLPVRGIRDIEPADIAYARGFGCRIKLLGRALLVGDSPQAAGSGGIDAEVAPMLVPESGLTARVDGAYNAVRIEGDAMGSVFLHGKGAGSLPTGSAVAADIIAVARGALPNNTGFAQPSLPAPARIIPHLEGSGSYYIRLQVTDKPGVLRDVAAVMAENNISIAQAIQKTPEEAAAAADPAFPPETARDGCPCVSFIVMTHEAKTAGVYNALRTLATSSMVLRPPVYYRVLPNGG